MLFGSQLQPLDYGMKGRRRLDSKTNRTANLQKFFFMGRCSKPQVQRKEAMVFEGNESLHQALAQFRESHGFLYSLVNSFFDIEALIDQRIYSSMKVVQALTCVCLLQ